MTFSEALKASSAYTLVEICKRATLEKKRFKIVRADKQHDLDNNWFRFSAHENTKTNVFSVDDLSAYWLIFHEETEPKFIEVIEGEAT